jgi:transcriptional regulator NrdR family protein
MKCINGHKVACIDSRERRDGCIRRRYKCYLCTDRFSTLETKDIKRTRHLGRGKPSLLIPSHHHQVY